MATLSQRVEGLRATIEAKIEREDKAEEKGILAYNGYDWLHSQPKIMDVICYD